MFICFKKYFAYFSDYCTKKTRNEIIRTADNECVSVGRVQYNVCMGRCMGSQMIPLLYANVDANDPTKLYSKGCKCCTGMYSRTSMARTPLGPCKVVRDRGSSSS